MLPSPPVWARLDILVNSTQFPRRSTSVRLSFLVGLTCVRDLNLALIEDDAIPSERGLGGH